MCIRGVAGALAFAVAWGCSSGDGTEMGATIDTVVGQDAPAGDDTVPGEDASPSTDGSDESDTTPMPGDAVEPPGDTDVADPGTICCAEFGAEGRLVCPLGLVREAEQVALPVGLQFRIAWDAARASLFQFQDELCVPEGCFDVAVPPQALQPTGHSVTISPKKREDWEGGGVVLILVPSATPPPVTEAYLDGSGGVVGDPYFVEIVLDATDTISEADPLCFEFSDLAASKPDFTNLVTRIEGGFFVVGESDP